MLSEAVASFTPESVRSLLAAAACGPCSGHRRASAFLLWANSIARPPAGSVVAGAEHLDDLLAAARAAVPGLTVQEDWLPGDPRLTASFDYGCARYRIHPGPVEYALDQLDDLAMWAAVTDDLTIETYGFRLSDLILLAIRYSDAVVSALAPAWPQTSTPFAPWKPDHESSHLITQQVQAMPAKISDAEVSSYLALNVDALFEAAVAAGGAPAAHAADWASGDAADAAEVMSRSPGQSLPWLTLRAGGRRHPIPVSELVPTLHMAAAVLLEGLPDRAKVQGRVAGITMAELRDTLTQRRESHEPPPEPDVDEPHSPEAQDACDAAPVMALVPVSHNVVLVIAGVCALEPAEMEQQIQQAHNALASVRLDRFASMGLAVNPAADIIPVIATAGPIRARLGVIEQGSPFVLAAQEVRLLLRSAISNGGPDELWRFLRAATGPGHLGLASPTVLDAWRFWCGEAGLIFDDISHLDQPALTRSGWGVTDESWQDYATWDSIDDALHRFAMPPARWFPHAELEDHLPGTALLWASLPGSAFCLAAPNLLVAVGLADEFLTVSPAISIALSLATAVRDRLATIGVAAALAEPVLLVLDVDITGDSTPMTIAGAPTHPVHALRLGADWFNLLARDPQAASTECGRLVLALLAPHLAADGEPFLTRWTEQGLIMVTGRHITPRAPRRALTMQRSRSADRAAWRAVETANPLPAGLHRGTPARNVNRDHLHPAALAHLGRQGARFDHTATLISALALLDECLGQLEQRRDDIRFGLAGPWADTVRDSALAGDEDLLDMSRRAQVLIEHLHAGPTTGDPGLRRPDRFDLTDLLAAAGAAIDTGAAAGQPLPALHNLFVVVQERGRVEIHTTTPVRTHAHITEMNADTGGPGTPGGSLIVDLRRYSEARQQHAHRMGPLDEPEPSSDLLDSDHPFTDLDWKALPATYQSVETAMVAELGTGISAITAVLADLTSRIPDPDGILRLDPDRTLNDIAEWATTVPRSQIGAATTLLTLPPGIALDWWRLEKRTHRLVTNPLLHHNGIVLTTPHLLQTTRTLWAGYLSQGRLPWPGISHRLREKVNLLATRGGEDFEDNVANTISSLHWPYRAGITFEELTERGLAVHGEIDALVADVTRRRIWLVEAKSGIVPHAVDAIYTEVQRYHKPRGYLDRALSNAAALQAAAATAAELLDLAGDRWQVIPLMVTRHVSPAAFVADPRVAFTVLEDLTAVLTANEIPPAGHVPVGVLRP